MALQRCVRESKTCRPMPAALEQIGSWTRSLSSRKQRWQQVHCSSRNSDGCNPSGSEEPLVVGLRSSGGLESCDNSREWARSEMGSDVEEGTGSSTSARGLENESALPEVALLKPPVSTWPPGSQLILDSGEKEVSPDPATAPTALTALELYKFGPQFNLLSLDAHRGPPGDCSLPQG